MSTVTITGAFSRCIRDILSRPRPKGELFQWRRPRRDGEDAVGIRGDFALGEPGMLPARSRALPSTRAKTQDPRPAAIP